MDHNAEELAQRNMLPDKQEMSVNHMWELLDKSKKELEMKFPFLPHMETVKRECRSNSQYEPYPRFLNKIGEAVRNALGLFANVHT